MQKARSAILSWGSSTDLCSKSFPESSTSDRLGSAIYATSLPDGQLLKLCFTRRRSRLFFTSFLRDYSLRLVDCLELNATDLRVTECQIPEHLERRAREEFSDPLSVT